MSKTVLPVIVPDISVLAKSIRRELDARTEKPSHVEILNMLARAAGFRNFQHMKASQAAEQRLENQPTPKEPEAVDHRRIETVLRCFDGNGVMTRWPSKTAQQRLALWWFWSALPPRREMTEREVNEVLKRLNSFGDHVLVRRELIDWKMMWRSLDCSICRRIEQEPPAEARVLIRHLTERVRQVRSSQVFGRFRPVRPDALPTSP